MTMVLQHSINVCYFKKSSSIFHHFRFLYSGYKTPLNDERVWDLLPEEEAEPRVRSLYGAWQKSSQLYDKHSTQRSLPQTIACKTMWDSGAQPPSNMSLDGPTADCKNTATTTTETDVCETTPLLGEHDSVKDSEQFEKGHTTFDSWRNGNGLVWAVWKSFGIYYASLGIYEALFIVLTFTRPILLE